ncbi:hypothetical protein ACRAWD_16385 [Caulobacter segnis]
MQLSPMIPGSTDIASVPDESQRRDQLARPGRGEAELHDLSSPTPCGSWAPARTPDRLRSRRTAAALRLKQVAGSPGRRGRREAPDGDNRILRRGLRPGAQIKGLAETRRAEGAPRRIGENGLWTQPGVFGLGPPGRRAPHVSCFAGAARVFRSCRGRLRGGHRPVGPERPGARRR